MIEVYRIEHKETKLGPFQTEGDYTQSLARKAGSVRYLRDPLDDGFYILPRGYIFGCDSLNLLKRWVFLGASFDENAEIVHRLDNLGFALAEYIVDRANCRTGRTGVQLMFNATQARKESLVSYQPLSRLLRESPLVFCTRDSFI